MEMQALGENGYVRWDAVVDCRRDPETARAAREPAGGARAAQQPVNVKVSLFGTLADHRVKRPLELALDGELTVAAVIGALNSRLGGDFLHKVVDAAGTKLNQCVVFVDGVKVDDLNAPVQRGAASVQVEMILLTVIEGG